MKTTMKTMLKHALLPAAFVAAVPAVQAAQVEVTWDNPDSFRDIQAANAAKGKFQHRVLGDLEKHFKKVGERLPEGQTLSLTVTDVDLAGYVEYFNPAYPFGLRVLRDIDVPRITLDYVLTDGDGNIINSGSGNLTDMGYRFPTFASRYPDFLDYEKRMIDRWYSRNFS